MTATKSTARCLSHEFLVRTDTIVLHICYERWARSRYLYAGAATFIPGAVRFLRAATVRIEHEFYAPALDPVSGHDQTESRMVHQLRERVFLWF
jgi:hypothetical protein